MPMGRGGWLTECLSRTVLPSPRRTISARSLPANRPALSAAALRERRPHDPAGYRLVLRAGRLGGRLSLGRIPSMKHIVGFSGGIDSQACALWVRNRFPAQDVILLNTNAGRNESPLTEAFISHYSETVFPVRNCFAIPADFNTPPFTQDAW